MSKCITQISRCNNEYEVNVEDSDNESEVISTYQSSMKYKCLKTCWVISLPILVVIGILIAIAIVGGLVGGWITCVVFLSMNKDSLLLLLLVLSPAIVLGGIASLIVIGMALYVIVITIGIILGCIYEVVKCGLSAIDEYERECHQIEVHDEVEVETEVTESV